MSRQEDFIEAGIEYRFKYGTPNAIGGGAFANMVRELNRAKPFEAGAEHGYQYAIDKACEWLEEEAIHGWIESEEVDKFIGLFRKSMEE